jgi:hypothetical protein
MARGGPATRPAAAALGTPDHGSPGNGYCPGLGGIHLLNGRYDAKLDHAPVLAITGMRGQPHKATIATTLFRDRIEQLKG